VSIILRAGHHYVFNKKKKRRKINTVPVYSEPDFRKKKIGKAK